MSVSSASLSSLIADTERLLAASSGRFMKKTKDINYQSNYHNNSAMAQSGPNITGDWSNSAAFDSSRASAIDVTVERPHATMNNSIGPPQQQAQAATNVDITVEYGHSHRPHAVDAADDGSSYWLDLNRSLVALGFRSVVAPVASHPEALTAINQRAVVNAIKEVADAYESAQSSAASLKSDGAHHAQLAGHLQRQLNEQLDNNTRLAKRIEELEAANHRQLVELGSLEQASRQAFRSRDDRIDSLQKKLNEVQGKLKAKEATAASLQATVDQQLDSLNQSSAAEQEILQQTEEIHKLRQELKMSAADKATQLAIAGQRVRQAEEQLIKTKDTLAHTQYQVEKLSSEVSERVSPDVHKKLERELAAVQGQLRELKAKDDYRQYHSQRANMKRDKAIHANDLQAIARLPHSALVEVLQDICLDFDLFSIDAIRPTMASMRNIVEAVPAMQAFIRNIVDLVEGNASASDLEENEEEEKENNAKRGETTSERIHSLSGQAMKPERFNSVLPQLKGWLIKLRHMREFESFHRLLVRELAKRKHRVHSEINEETPAELLSQELMDLVDTENRLFTLIYGPVHHENRIAANEEQLLRVPSSTDPIKMLAHFQQLFDVPHSNGIYPKMNEIYLFVNELRAGLVDMRALLRLDNKATLQTIVNAIRGLPAVSVGGGGASGRDGAANLTMNGQSADFGHLEPTKPAPLTAGERSLAKSAALSKSVRHLKGLLGVKSVDAIAPMVERLLKREAEFHQRASEFEAAGEMAEKLRESSRVIKQVAILLDQTGSDGIIKEIHRLKNVELKLCEVDVNGPKQLASARQHADQAEQRADEREEALERIKLAIGLSDEGAIVQEIKSLRRRVDAAKKDERDNEERKEQDAAIRSFVKAAPAEATTTAVRRLTAKLGQYETLFPSVDTLMDQLYALLNVSQLEAIVPAVRRLQQQANKQRAYDTEPESDEPVKYKVAVTPLPAAKPRAAAGASTAASSVPAVELKRAAAAATAKAGTGGGGRAIKK